MQITINPIIGHHLFLLVIGYSWLFQLSVISYQLSVRKREEISRNLHAFRPERMSNQL